MFIGKLNLMIMCCLFIVNSPTNYDYQDELGYLYDGWDFTSEAYSLAKLLSLLVT